MLGKIPTKEFLNNKIEIFWRILNLSPDCFPMITCLWSKQSCITNW